MFMEEFSLLYVLKKMDSRELKAINEDIYLLMDSNTQEIISLILYNLDRIYSCHTLQEK